MIPGFNWQTPDYVPIFRQRAEALGRIRAQVVASKKDKDVKDPLPALKLYYRDHIPQFITDWGCTYDPRNIERDLPAVMPFILFPRQVEYCDFVLRKWRERKRGLAEKSRDMGVSWLSVALADSLALHFDGVQIGFGSRKEEYVDKSDDPKSLFWKARKFLELLPPEFRGGWDLKRNSAHMRITIPETGGVITGEAGDNIGRGDRTSIYFVDEAAFIERPQLVEAALSQTTNCRIDVSTPNGSANPFAQRRFGGKTEVFTFHWTQDPRKDQAWYDGLDLDPVTLAQEVDLDYNASVEGVLIPSAWVTAALDAHKKLHFEPTGRRSGALDVADEGIDTNAFCGAHGVVVTRIVEWSGKGSDIVATTERAFYECDEYECDDLTYDADGLGAGVRGDARVVNARRKADNLPQITVRPFRGSGEVLKPDDPVYPGSKEKRPRLNKDFFSNRKAQAWWSLRRRFEMTYKAVTQAAKVERGEMTADRMDPVDFDAIISISKESGNYEKLVLELSQPTYSLNLAGKVIVDKKPEGAKSPNLADCVMIRFAEVSRGGVRVSADALGAI